MTAIFYPDLTTSSPNGRFTLEARSPNNGTIVRRSGKPPSENDFGFKYRQHQREFRYRLIGNTTTTTTSARSFANADSSVIWERWQEKGEDSPHELVVSDDGWSILRTHGFRPEVIAVALSGRETLRVRIAGPEAEYPVPSTTVPVFSWSPENLNFSTAGLYWTENSWRCFFRHGGIDYFGWRTSGGQLLLIDLREPALLPQPAPSHPLSLAAIEAEKDGVGELLSSFADRMGEVRDWFRPRAFGSPKPEGIDPKVSSLTSAFHLAGVHRMASVVSLLKEWEEIDSPGVWMGSTAMGGSWWLEVQAFRPILHHSLKLLGQTPIGLATYHFRNSDKGRFPMPERVPDRQGRAGGVRQEMSAPEILELLGSPDYIERRSHQEGTLFRPSEDWEYDFRIGDDWETFRITWEDRGRKGRILRFETVSPDWLETNDRESEILRF